MTDMEKLSITLPEVMLDHVQQQVRSGRYASTSEYIRDALRDRIAQDEEAAFLGARYRRALHELEAGETLSHDEVFGALESKLGTR